jgi:hypothetical protein
LKLETPAHGIAGQHGFGKETLQKALGGQDRHAALCCVGGIDHATGTQIMIGVTVRVNHRCHRQFAFMLEQQFQGGVRAFLRSQRVYHDPTLLAADKGDYGYVERARLVNPWNYLEEAVDVIELRVTP